MAVPEGRKNTGDSAVARIRRLRSHLSVACNTYREEFSRFAKAVGLSDFEIEAVIHDCPIALAAMAVATLVRTDHSVTMAVVCTGVFTFLDGEFQKPAEDPTQERRIKDLKAAVESNCDEAAYRQIFNAWYD